MPLNILSPFMEMCGIKLTQQRSINLKKTTNARLGIYAKICYFSYAQLSGIFWYFKFIYSCQSMISCFYGERSIKISKDIIDIETALTKYYLNDSSLNKSEICELNLYPHGYKNLLV